MNHTMVQFYSFDSITAILEHIQRARDNMNNGFKNKDNHSSQRAQGRNAVVSKTFWSLIFFWAYSSDICIWFIHKILYTLSNYYVRLKNMSVEKFKGWEINRSTEIWNCMNIKELAIYHLPKN